jgi:LuxR family maltose regulon positive regulatory protein
MRSAGSQESMLSILTSENANITGYLVDEVLSHQIPAIYSFLLKSSILNRFCASLCEAVIDVVDPAWDVHACLDWIERSDLFLTSLDNRREWYRYHHLFQELLGRRLTAEIGPDQVSDMHRRASAWFEEHGLLDEALHHALAAGDFDLAARQMSTGLRDALNHEDRLTLERWLRLLPEEVIQHHPGLLMIRAWALQFMWRLDLQAQALQQLEALLDSGEGPSLPAADLQLLRAQILLLRAQQAYFGNQPTQAIDYCRQALALLPPSWTFGRGAAMLYLGISMQAGGQAAEAERLLLDEYESYGDKADAYALLVLDSLCFIYLHTAQLEQARQIALLLLQGASRSGLAFMASLADWYLGWVCYQRNELEAAAGYFCRLVESRYTAQITSYRDAVAGLALTHQAQGQSTEARLMVESISQFDLEQRGSEDNRTRSLRARLQLLQGDLEAAADWVDAFTDRPPEQALAWLEEPQLTRVRVLAGRGTDADLRLALQILDALNEIADRTHNTHHKIEILALRALVSDAQGKIGTATGSANAAADSALAQALTLARPGGYIRVFVDLGRPMQAMLCRLVSHGYSKAAISRILAAFPADSADQVGGAPRLPLDRPAMTERLTRRELEILSLLREPLSIKEIALSLNISYATVRRHNTNIYDKLGASGRMSAVARAEALNILPPR